MEYYTSDIPTKIKTKGRIGLVAKLAYFVRPVFFLLRNSPE